MHRSIGIVVSIPLAFASEFFTNEVVDKLAERAFAMKPTEQSRMDTATLAKNYPSKTHGTQQLRPMPPGRVFFPRPHAPVSSVREGFPALQILHALGEHRSDVGAADRRHLISGLAATVAAVNIQATKQALAADNNEKFQLQQQIAVLNRLLELLTKEIADAKAATDRAAPIIKAVNEKGAVSEKQRATEAEREIAVTLAFASTVAFTALKTAGKVQNLAAQEITRADIEGFAFAEPNAALTEVKSAAGRARFLLEDTEQELNAARSYATASAKALPKVTEEKKKGSKTKDEASAVAVAVSAAGKAQSAITVAEAKVSEAADLIFKALAKL